jgi:excisionase family DNA binding protein
MQRATLPVEIKRNSRTEFEPLLDSNEAAQLLKVHPKTLQRMARRGEIPSIQIGKLWRFRGSELNAWAQV